MFYTSSWWVLIQALYQTSLFLGLNNWIPNTPAQYTFLTHFYAPLVKQIACFNPGELTAWAHQNSSELNAIVGSQGFSLQFAPTAYAYSINIASFLNIKEQSICKGTKTAIEHEITHQKYAAIKLTRDFEVYATALHSHPLACIHMRNGDSVWITPSNNYCAEPDFEYIRMLRSENKILDYSYTDIIFPDFIFSKEMSVESLQGLQLGQWRINQTLVKVLCLLDCQQSIPTNKIASYNTIDYQAHKTMLINQPFLLWIERPALHEPLFAACISEQYWKNGFTS